MFAKLWQLSRQKLGNVRLLNTSNLIKIPFETWIPLVYGPSKKLSRFKRAARPATTQLWNSSKVLTDAASVENVRADSSGLVASESFQRFLHNLRLRLWIFLVWFGIHFRKQLRWTPRIPEASLSGNKFSGVGVAAAVGSTTCKHWALIEEKFTVQRWDVLQRSLPSGHRNGIGPIFRWNLPVFGRETASTEAHEVLCHFDTTDSLCQGVWVTWLFSDRGSGGGLAKLPSRHWKSNPSPYQCAAWQVRQSMENKQIKSRIKYV